MGNGHLIFSAIFVVGFIVLIILLLRKSRRCRWCHKPTVKIQRLPDHDRNRIGELIRDEGMDERIGYEYCPHCRRIFDEGWFYKDWDMSDRWCACGHGLSFPWDVDTRNLREAVSDLPREIIALLLKRYTREDIAHLLGGYDDFLYRDAKRPEGHALRVCEYCQRIYMWIEKGGYQIFQCVSASREKYKRIPKRPLEA